MVPHGFRAGARLFHQYLIEKKVHLLRARDLRNQMGSRGFEDERFEIGHVGPDEGFPKEIATAVPVIESQRVR